MSKSGLCIIFTYWFIIQVKDDRKMQNGPHAKQRGSWYGISPVTRTMPNKKAYDRNDAKVLMKRDTSPEEQRELESHSDDYDFWERHLDARLTTPLEREIAVSLRN